MAVVPTARRTSAWVLTLSTAKRRQLLGLAQQTGRDRNPCLAQAARRSPHASSVAIRDGLVYAADLSGFVYAFDAATGKEHWKYDSYAAVWGSPFAADGKVYIGDEDGDVAVLRAGTKLQVLAENNLGAAVYTTPVAHDGVMFVVSRTKLVALKEGIPAKPPPPPPPPPAAKPPPPPPAGKSPSGS